MPLNARQLRAIEALLVSKTVTEAAKAAKVNRTTMFRFLRDPEFRDELRQAQRAVLNQNMRGVATMAKVAVETMIALMKSGQDDKLKFEVANSAIERLFDADLALRADEASQAAQVPGHDSPARLDG